MLCLNHKNEYNINLLSIQDNNAMELKKLKTDSAVVGTALSYLPQEEVQLIETTLGSVQMGSMH